MDKQQLCEGEEDRKGKFRTVYSRDSSRYTGYIVNGYIDRTSSLPWATTSNRQT